MLCFIDDEPNLGLLQRAVRWCRQHGARLTIGDVVEPPRSHELLSSSTDNTKNIQGLIVDDRRRQLEAAIEEIDSSGVPKSAIKVPGAGVLMFRIITPLFLLLRRCSIRKLSDRLILPIQLLRKAQIIELPKPFGNVNPSPNVLLGIRIPLPLRPRRILHHHIARTSRLRKIGDLKGGLK